MNWVTASMAGIWAIRDAVVAIAARARSVVLVTAAVRRPGCAVVGAVARRWRWVAGWFGCVAAAEAAVAATEVAGRPRAGWPDWVPEVVAARRRSSSEMSSSRMGRRRRSRGARSVRQAARAATPGRELLTA